MKNTHKSKIINFVKNRDWVSGYDIEKYAIEAGGKPATFGRRAREIAEAGIFARRMNGKNVEYKYYRTIPNITLEDCRSEITSNVPKITIDNPKQDTLLKVDFPSHRW